MDFPWLVAVEGDTEVPPLWNCEVFDMDTPARDMDCVERVLVGWLDEDKGSDSLVELDDVYLVTSEEEAECNVVKGG